MIFKSHCDNIFLQSKMNSVYSAFRSSGNKILLTDRLIEKFPARSVLIKRSIAIWVHDFAKMREDENGYNLRLDEYSVECYVDCLNGEFISLKSTLLTERSISSNEFNNELANRTSHTGGRDSANSSLDHWRKNASIGRKYSVREDVQGDGHEQDDFDPVVRYTDDSIDQVDADGAQMALDSMATGWKLFNKRSTPTEFAYGQPVTTTGYPAEDIAIVTNRARVNREYEMQRRWHRRPYARGDDVSESFRSSEIDGQLRGHDMQERLKRNQIDKAARANDAAIADKYMKTMGYVK
jgi:hypothetical protein